MNSKFSQCEGWIFAPLWYVLLLSLLKLSIAQSTAPTSSYPPDIFHEIVNMGTLTNPTTAGQTTITTVTRPHNANVVYLGNPKVFVLFLVYVDWNCWHGVHTDVIFEL